MLKRMQEKFSQLWRDTRGATAIEYGLLVVIIAIALLTFQGIIGRTVCGFFMAANAGL